MNPDEVRKEYPFVVEKLEAIAAQVEETLRSVTTAAVHAKDRRAIAGVAKMLEDLRDKQMAAFGEVLDYLSTRLP